MNIKQTKLQLLKENNMFTGFLMTHEVFLKTNSKGSEYLELKLSDASCQLKAFLWDIRAIEGDINSIKPDVFVMVKGQITSHNGRMQLKLDKIRFAKDSEIENFEDFFPHSKRHIVDMINELQQIIKNINDPWIKLLLEKIFIHNNFIHESFPVAPAAKSLHHAWIGGLIEHTLSMLKMAEAICTQYHQLNFDLIAAGILLHDIGKTSELTYKRSFNYSDIGNLIGHINIAVELINKTINTITNFPEELRLLIIHIVLSHHGKLEYGSPILPKTPEAILVHYLDDLDAKMNTTIHNLTIDIDNENHWTPFIKNLDCSLYKSNWPTSI